MQSKTIFHWLENPGSPLGVNCDQRGVSELERTWRALCARGTAGLPSGGSTSQLTLGRSPGSGWRPGRAPGTLMGGWANALAPPDKNRPLANVASGLESGGGGN